MVAVFEGVCHAPSPLPLRLDRYPVGTPGTAPAARASRWAAAGAAAARGDRRPALRAAGRHRLARLAPRLPALADGLPLLPRLAPGRDLGAAQRRAARAGAG